MVTMVYLLAVILGSISGYLVRYLVTRYLANRHKKPERALVRERLSKQILVLESDCSVGTSVPMRFPVDMRREIMVFHNGLLLSTGDDSDVSITPTELFFSFKLKARDIIQVVQVLTPET